MVKGSTLDQPNIGPKDGEYLIAQRGNLLAKEEVVQLVRFTIDEWLDRYHYLSRWKGYSDELRVQVEGCIHRYRYTGSFFNYLFRTLEYAGRGIRPLHIYSSSDFLG